MRYLLSLMAQIEDFVEPQRALVDFESLGGLRVQRISLIDQEAVPFHATLHLAIFGVPKRLLACRYGHRLDSLCFDQLALAFLQALVEFFLLELQAVRFVLLFMPDKHARDQIVLAPVDFLHFLQLGDFIRPVLVRNV